jgi:hypothetical protein
MRAVPATFLAIVASALASLSVYATSPSLERPPLPAIEPPPIGDVFDLPRAEDFAICISARSYSGCCSSHAGVKDIRDDMLICHDDAPSRTCNGVAAPLKGCCSGHGGIYGVNTDGVVLCNDQTSSASCHLGLCNNDDEKTDDQP